LAQAKAFFKQPDGRPNWLRIGIAAAGASVAAFAVYDAFFVSADDQDEDIYGDAPGFFSRYWSKVTDLFLPAPPDEGTSTTPVTVPSASAGSSRVMDPVKWKAFLTKYQTVSGALPGGADAYLYSDAILTEAANAGMDPFVGLGIGIHESRWGRALTPPGPAGCGDYTLRATTRSLKRGCKWVDPFAIPRGWRAPTAIPNKDTGALEMPPGQWYCPADERGFGRGLGQMDWVNAPVDVQVGGWDTGPVGVRLLFQALKKKRAEVQAVNDSNSLGMNDQQITTMAVAAYNWGIGGVTPNLLKRRFDDLNNPYNPGYAVKTVMPIVANMLALWNAYA
jgi:hypothetical protein